MMLSLRDESARALGYAGLIPFVAFALDAVLFHLLPAGVAMQALLFYSAVIASFLGGIVWGRAIGGGRRTGEAFVISVIPSLSGWVALMVGGAMGLALCATAFATVLFYDLRDDLPEWFAQLRLHLSIGAIASMILAAIFG